MKFESQRKRAFWFNYAMRIVFEYVLIYLILKLFQSSYDNSSQIGEAFIGLLVLWGLEIAIGLKNSLFQYIFYKWKGKEEAVEEFLDSFRRLNLPKPSEFYLDADGYIEDSLKDQETSEEGKVFLSMVFGVLTAFRNNQMILRAGLYQSSFEEAVKRYQSSFNR